jgi:hypothetical protein
VLRGTPTGKTAGTSFFVDNRHAAVTLSTLFSVPLGFFSG